MSTSDHRARLMAILSGKPLPTSIDGASASSVEAADEGELPIEGVKVDDAPADPGVPPAPTALRLDGWGISRGENLLEASDRLSKFASLGAEDEARVNAAADFYGAAFNVEPELNHACVDRQRHQFMEALMGQPEYAALHSSTFLDDDASTIAAVAFAQQYEELTLERERRAEQKKKDERDPRKPKKDKGDEEMEDAMACAAAAAKACEAASEEVAEHNDSRDACGMGPGGPGKSSPDRMAQYFQRVKNSAQLKKIIALAGRYRRAARGKQMNKTRHGYDDMVGIDLSGDLARAVPAELAKYSHRLLRMDFLRRLVERQLLSRDWRTVEPQDKGPVWICVDRSGSMSGDKVAQAKALALAMGEIARMQKRWIVLMSFDGQYGKPETLTGLHSNNHDLVVFPPGRWDPLAMLDWLEGPCKGGSCHDVPVREMPALWNSINPPRGKTDLVFVTDAECALSPADAATFNDWKVREKVKLISLVIGKRQGGETLSCVSDQLFGMPILDVEEEGVSAALSI